MLKRVKDIKKVIEFSQRVGPFRPVFKQFTVSANPEVQQRLENVDEDLKTKYPWLSSEEDMRKHFNIIDWNDVEKEEHYQRIKNIGSQTKPFEKREIDEEDVKKIAQQLRKEIYSTNSQGKMVDKHKNDDDYEVPEEVVNFERNVDMTRFRDDNFYKRFNEENNILLREMDYLKDKPKNYLLVSGFKPDSPIDELLIIIKSLGQVGKTNIVEDLCKKPALVEVYYYTEQDAYNAKMQLDGYKFNNLFLTARSVKDYEKEQINSRTLIIGNLPNYITSEHLAEVLSDFGNVMKVELPLEEIKSNNKKIYDDVIANYKDSPEKSLDTIYDHSDKFVNEFLENNSKENEDKLSFFFKYKKVKDIVQKIGTLSQRELSDESYEKLKVLYNEFKFHVQKIFPKEVVNSLIYHEVVKLDNSAELVEGFSQIGKEKAQQAFGKIFSNMKNFIEKYDQKIKVLAEGITEELTPVDIFEPEYDDLNQEKLHKKYTKKAIDETEPRRLKTDLREMNMLALCTPLLKQIEKIKFYRSLTPEERDAVSDKYNINFKVNTPQFIDYFLQFSRAMGMQIFDKQVELANLFLSMSPVEKEYLGRKLAKDPKKLASFDGELMDFLDLKRRSTINKPYENLHLLNELDKMDKNMTSRLNNMTYKSKKEGNYGEFLQTEQLTFEQRIMENYIDYFSRFIRYQRVIPIMRIKLDQFTKEVKNVQEKILEAGDIYMKKYGERLDKLMFPKVADYYRMKEKSFGFKKSKQLNKNDESAQNKFLNIIQRNEKLEKLEEENDEIEENSESEEKVYMKDEEDPELAPLVKELKEHEEELRKNFGENGQNLEKSESENETSGKDGKEKTSKAVNAETKIEEQKLDPQLDFDIKNALDDLEHYQGKFFDKLLAIDKYILPKNAHFEVLKEHMKKKLIEFAKKLSGGDEDLLKASLDKLEDSLKAIKYVDLNFDQKEFKMIHLVEDLVAKEMEWLEKARNMGPVDKDSLAKVLGTYEVISKANDDQRGNFEVKKTFFEFFQSVQSSFLQEIEKLEDYKEKKLETLENEIFMDDVYNERKGLIEDYVNKVYALDEFKKLSTSLEEKTKEELDLYKLKNIGKNQLFLESDDEAEVDALKNEIRKKKYENIKNKNNFSTTPAAGADDVLANFKADNEYLEDSDTALRAKLQLMLKKKRTVNRGYAFVTFANSDQAKKIFLFSNKISIDGNTIKALPKFTTSHEDLDLEYLKNKGKNQAMYIKKKNEVEEARQKLNEFERQFKDKLDKSNEDYKKVIEGYKDIFSDPYKRHDSQYNPFDSDEEFEIRKNIEKQENEHKLNHLWLYEDDKLEELRKIKDKKIAKKYIDWQLLKRGVIPEKENKTAEKKKEGFTFYSDVLEDIVSEQPELALESESDRVGRKNNLKKSFGPGDFAEKYLGKDLLEVPAFKKNKKISTFFQPMKELSERFPKEKFIDRMSDYEKTIEGVREDYIKYLKKYDKKEKILEKLAPITPINALIEPILEERKNFIMNNRENITYQTFMQRSMAENFFRAEDLTSPPIDRNNITFKHEEEDLEVVKKPQQVVKDAEKEAVKEFTKKEEEDKDSDDDGLDAKNQYILETKIDKIERELEEKKMFFKQLEKKGYDFSKDPQNLDILPYGFKGGKKNMVENDYSKMIDEYVMEEEMYRVNKNQLKTRRIDKILDEEQMEEDEALAEYDEYMKKNGYHLYPRYHEEPEPEGKDEVSDHEDIPENHYERTDERDFYEDEDFIDLPTLKPRQTTAASAASAVSESAETVPPKAPAAPKTDKTQGKQRNWNKKDNNKQAPNKGTKPNEGDKDQFDPNLLSAEKIRALKKNRNVEKEELIKSAVEKFKRLQGENEAKEFKEDYILEKFENFISNKSEGRFAGSKDEVERKSENLLNKNYSKFLKKERFNTGFHSYKEETVQLDKEKEEEIENLKRKSKNFT